MIEQDCASITFVLKVQPLVPEKFMLHAHGMDWMYKIHGMDWMYSTHGMDWMYSTHRRD